MSFISQIEHPAICKIAYDFCLLNKLKQLKEALLPEPQAERPDRKNPGFQRTVLKEPLPAK